MALRFNDSLARRLMKPDKSIYIFGAISIFLIGFAFLFVLFVNIGAGTGPTLSYVDMLLTGFFGSFAFSMILAASRRRKGIEAEAEIFQPLSSKSVMTQLNTVIPVGLMTGTFLVMINLGISVGGNMLLGSAFGSIDPTNFALGLLAGVAEELFFRGFLQTMFEFFMGGTLIARYFAPIPTALIFAWFHHFAYTNNIVAWWVIFGIGLGLGYIMAFSKDIGTPMLAHVFNNAFAMLPILIAFLQVNLIIFVFFGVLVAIAFVFGSQSIPRRK
ncbi:MAG: lysostaphin resistance A-like protein [Candidatus Thorarchaeota archaeon]